MPTAAERRRAFLVLWLTPLFFSGNLVLGRWAVGQVEPFTLAFLRWAIATAILFAVAAPGLRQHAEALKREWRMLLLLGFFGMWLSGGAVYYALKHTTATNGSLIYSTASVMMLLLDWLFLGRRIGRNAVAGIVLGLSGVAVIVFEGRLERFFSLSLNTGDLIVAAATAGWSVYSLILKRPVFQAMPTMTLFAGIAGMGTLTLLPFAAWETIATGHVPTGLKPWGAILVLAVVSSVLAFGAFQYGVRILGPGIAGMFVYLFPAAAVGMAILVLGETPKPYHAAGFVLIIAGVVMATAPRDLIAARWAAFRGRPVSRSSTGPERSR
ncbi:DMT family transporter [Prosthecomicrobium sp. N25]|uniref:DMT family transporter n=1 Tax=Prosthecomicrobium sp. N25 TaxID=3129254 RepID=UPI0030774F67